MTLLLSACGYNSHDLDVAYDAGYDRGYKDGAREGIDDAVHSACADAGTKNFGIEEALYVADCFLGDLPDKEDLTEEDYRAAFAYLYNFTLSFYEDYYA